MQFGFNAKVVHFGIRKFGAESERAGFCGLAVRTFASASVNVISDLYPHHVDDCLANGLGLTFAADFDSEGWRGKPGTLAGHLSCLDLVILDEL